MRDLRRSAWLIVAAALLPLLLFLIFQIGYSAREERGRIERQALATSEAIVLAADARVAQAGAGIDALASAPSLRSGNLAEFRRYAQDLAGISGGWTGLRVAEAQTDRTILTIGALPDRILRTRREGPGERAAFAGFAWGPACPCILFERATTGVDGRPLRLAVFVFTRDFARLLPSPKAEYPVSAIVDASGLFIARTLGDKERFGRPGSIYVRRASLGGARQGMYRGLTLEGLDNYSAFTRSSMTGWSAHVALKSDIIDNPARRFAASLGTAAFVSLLLALLLILFALRQLAQARHLNERMQQAQKLEALGQLTGGIAHDFNNLLTPIVGALDFLSRKAELDARGRRLAMGALTSARRAGRLTAQLLTFSRRQKLHIEAVALDPILPELADLFDQSVGDTHRVVVEVAEPGLCVWTDANQLELAILNLVINARDASPEGSTITIGLSASSRQVKIEVRDSGSGMDEATRTRAIEPFFSTKPVGRGTGLGLSQAFATAEQSGGRLTIASAPGEGTTVTLILRRCEPGQGRPAERDASGALELLAERQFRLLVVDDEPEVRSALCRPLEDAGHLVDSVSDGATALAAMGGTSFDLVLVDFAMPDMDGAALIRQARERASGTRFLLVTGYADSESVARQAPGVPILAKPFEPDELVAAVGELLGR